MPPNHTVTNALELPDDWWKDDLRCGLFADYFSRHIVCTYVEYMRSGELCYEMYTGFLLEYRGLWMWMTAGHVVEALEGLYDADDVDVRAAGWFDGHPSSLLAKIPSDLKNLTKARVDADGVDLGVVCPRDLELLALTSNPNTQAFTEHVWRGKSSARPEGYYLVGVPQELHNPTGSPLDLKKDAGVRNVQIACLPVERLEPEPEREPRDFWRHASAFYGRILPPTQTSTPDLESIRGMSGGPIFSIERTPEGRLLYRLFAIQSRWLPESRVLRATPIEALVEALEDAYRTATEQAG